MLFALICFTTGFAQPGYAITDTVSYIGVIPKQGEPTNFIDAFHKFTWDVTIFHKNCRIETATTRMPDTLFTGTDIDSVNLRSNLYISPHLLNQDIGMHFILKGSSLIRLNDDTILQTGCFQLSKEHPFHYQIVDDITFITLKDTIEKLSIRYKPLPGIPMFDFGKLSLIQKNQAEIRKSELEKDTNDAYRFGFYYLAIGIVFLVLFIYYREKTENLYFSLFCIFSSLSFLTDIFHSNLFAQYDGFVCALCFEFLSIFLYKIFKNKEKSKTPLVIIVSLTLICFLPFVNVYFTLLPPFSGKPQPVITATIQIICIAYALIISFYYLMQGINKKTWESRTILFFCTIPILSIFLFIIFFIIVAAVVSANKNFRGNESIIENLAKSIPYIWQAIVYIYPLSAVVILGKRNGLNQLKLVAQVRSIQHLSEENLAKEREKKQILENQNQELERKVTERTLEVMHQKELIEIKNRAITDNINYALRIQSAILPDIKLIYQTLQHSFILYLPKDIVSGDFYAFAERGSNVIIIAGDCTGHGVSGALMSMIGSSLLNQIINEKGLYEPAAILNQLNAAIIETLKQKENKTSDGMDVSVCSFNSTEGLLQYAGANRPLWLIRKGEHIVFKPDKLPIGGQQVTRDRQFTNHVIPLEKDDTFYIFSDGYADQFGGERGKKMMTTRFANVLLNIQHLNMREQETYLKNYFETWKGDNDQVDDVLVIGIKV